MAEFWFLLRQETRRLFTDKAILLTLFGGLLYYFLLYPSPYANQVARELPVILVDQDDSVLSRQLAFMADATPNLKWVATASTLEAAQQRLRHNEARGILVIPPHFMRDVRLGRSVTLALAADATYFLSYSGIAEGLSTAAATLGVGIQVQRRLASGEALPQALNDSRPFAVNSVPLFNPTLGYQPYVLPAVFLLILHQTLLIGAGLQACGQRLASQAGESGYWQSASPLTLLAARTSLFTLLYLLFALAYLVVGLAWYGLPRLATLGQLLLLWLPLFMTISCVGSLLGSLLPRRELVTALVVLSSLPIVFVTGFIWPNEGLPAWQAALAQWIPATPGIQAFLKLQVEGASLSQIRPELWQIYRQLAVYGLLAWWGIRRHRRVV